MLFNSFDFLIYFIVVWMIQYILPHRPRNVFLLLASCFFYGYWDWRFLSILWFTIFVDYFVALKIDSVENDQTRYRYLLISVITNLGVLAFFKYANFFLDNVNELLSKTGAGTEIQFIHIVLPLGISFYTFQSISYVVDVYRRKMPPLKSILDYALYVTLFPQLVAGPIERGAHLANQIVKKTIPTLDDYKYGTFLILKGLFKKAVLADNLAVIVDQIFANPAPTGPEVLIGVYAFAFQIYGDFSGYTDMARGVAKWLGYDLLLNFRLPYFAISPSDFWQRWHISLSSWLRDYLYIPLGGNRGSQLMTYRNLFLTMLLGGLWHGAAWNFILWGIYHGILLVMFRACQISAPQQKGNIYWWLTILVMFHLTCFGWLLFRANSVHQIQLMLMALGTHWELTSSILQKIWVLTLLIVPLLMYQLLQEFSGALNFVQYLTLPTRVMFYTLVIVCILTLGNFGGREFVYFRF